MLSWRGLFFSPQSFPQTPSCGCSISPGARLNLRPSIFGPLRRWDLSEPSFLRLRKSTMLPPPKMKAQFSLSMPLLPPVPATSPLQPLVHAVQTFLASAGITGTTLTRLRSAEPRVPVRETNNTAGGCFYPACRFYKLFWGIFKISSLPAVFW